MRTLGYALAAGMWLVLAGPAHALDWDPPTPVPAGEPTAEVAVDAGETSADAGLLDPTRVPVTGAHSDVGHAAGWFYLRADDDNFILIPTGRAELDYSTYQGGSSAPFSTFLVKRARLEAMGTLLKHWDFRLGGEFVDSSTPVASDVYVNANYTRYANIQVGQFDAPFTMENRTHDEWTDLQERARSVGALGIPENKEVGLMVWGQPEGQWAYWSAGVFNGEGATNLPHLSNDFDVMGRAWFAPFGLADIDELRWIWFGGSVWNGFRSNLPTAQLDRPAMTDPGGFVFWNPVYGAIHTGDQGALNKWALEVNVPVGSVVLKGEWVNNVENTRELDETVPSNPIPVYNGQLTGYGYYLRAVISVWGDPLINGLGGMQNPPHLFGTLAPDPHDDALQVVLNAEHLDFTYTSHNLKTTPLGEPGDQLVGVDGAVFLGGGVNYWYTKHVRLTANFIYDVFNGKALKPEVLSSSEYELTLRVALVL